MGEGAPKKMTDLEKLTEMRDRLEAQLKKVNSAIQYFEANPNFADSVELLAQIRSGIY